NSALALNGGGGALVVKGGAVANTQQFNGAAVNTGASSILVTAGSGGSATLTLNAISRAANNRGTINFDSGIGASITTTAANVNDILGGYATFKGTDWATGGGTIAAYSGYVNDDYSASTNNVNVTDFSPTPSGTINTLRFNTSAVAGSTLTLSGQ